MQISRRQFNLTVLIGAVVLLITRLFGGLFGRLAGPSLKERRDGFPARYWRRGDHLAG